MICYLEIRGRVEKGDELCLFDGDLASVHVAQDQLHVSRINILKQFMIKNTLLFKKKKNVILQGCARG